jgi:hypothetical protein
MKLTDDVMNDLLTVYLAGEASADTKALVESHARQHPAFAARLQAAGDFALPDVPPAHRDAELGALADTRRFILFRTIFLAAAVLFTLLPLVFTIGDEGPELLILGRHAGLVWAFWSLAAASWSAWYVFGRSLRRAGL